ncbi:MAG TPA: VOC family protein [Trebonia sp.]|nr:VOC family protein [Trebonia sp.]
MDLGASDIPKAISFYSSQFGWAVQQGGPEVGGYSMAQLNGRSVAGIGPAMGPPGTPSAWATYFASGDVDASAARLKSAGGTLLVEPVDVMDAGRMLVAADTTGATFGVWQARSHTGAQVVNVPGAFTWSEHMSRDFEGAKAFYAAVFGYEYGDMSSDGFSYATLLINGQQVVGGIGAYPEGADGARPAFWGVYFGTADTDRSVELLTSHGGTVIRPASDSPYGRMAIVADNQGAVFSLISTPEDRDD